MKVGVFGCGAYGMALSSILHENKCNITMWTKFEEEKKQLEETRTNEKLLPNFNLPIDIKLTTSIEECIKEKDLLIIAIPAAHVDTLAIEMKPYIKITCYCDDLGISKANLSRFLSDDYHSECMSLSSLENLYNSIISSLNKFFV